MADSSKQIQDAMMAFISELFPICRSITGNGVRQTLGRIAQEVPLEIHEIPSGTKVFDWIVPQEWNIDDAYIADSYGNRIVDFADNNLHVVSYSDSIDSNVSLDELAKHVHTLPDRPDDVPYRTSYYHRDWGFCLSHRCFSALDPGEYRVCIKSTLVHGFLTYGELCIPGDTDQEVLIYSHTCHPSLCNDNLSGLAVTLWWARSMLETGPGRYTYRFVWGPGTIGSLTWLALNRDLLRHIKHGLVAVLLGRPGEFVYKRSQQGDADIDRIVATELSHSGYPHSVRDFDPYGYDERQFCSSGINLPVGRLTRAPNGEYPEYHTSSDNLNLITGEALYEALRLCQKISLTLDSNRSYENRFPYGEPQLGRRGLYRNKGGDDPRSIEMAMLWLLNQADGTRELIDIAERSGLPMAELHDAAVELLNEKLLVEKSKS